MIKSKLGSKFIESLRLTDGRIRTTRLTFTTAAGGAGYTVTFRNWVQLCSVHNNSGASVNVFLNDSKSNEFFETSVSGGAPGALTLTNEPFILVTNTGGFYFPIPFVVREISIVANGATTVQFTIGFR